MQRLLGCAACVVAVFWLTLPTHTHSTRASREPIVGAVRVPLAHATADTPQLFQVPASGRANNLLTADEKAAGWILLFDGRTLEGWQQAGQATWTVEEGLVTSRGQVSGYLRSSGTFQDFDLKAEFLADKTMNSAIFVRCPADLKVNVSPRTCYEVNIYDPHELWPTGSVNEVQSTLPNRIETAGKWNQYEITLEGSRIIVKLNGKTTVDARDERFSSGTIALQANGPGSGGGVINFRNIKIRPIK